MTVLPAPGGDLSEYRSSYQDESEFEQTALLALSRNFTGIKLWSCPGAGPGSRSRLYSQIVHVCIFVCD